MNKASGKLAAGVRKVKTQQTAPAAVDKAPVPAPAKSAAPKRVVAAPRAAVAAPHPDRVWPD
jgi:hypothetical protein